MGGVTIPNIRSLKPGSIWALGMHGWLGKLRTSGFRIGFRCDHGYQTSVAILAQASLVQARSSLESSTRPYRNIRNMLSRRGLKVLWLACVMATADDEACALQKALGKPKIRDNYVYFYQKNFRDCRAIRAIP